MSKVDVINRDSIRNLPTVEHDGVVYALGEHRDFRRHPVLAEFLPESGRISLSWTKLKKFERLEPHRHPVSSMIIVCKGSGRLLGDIERPLNEGDVVTVPPGCLHGFIGAADFGFDALSLQFDGEGLYENETTPRVEFEGAALEKLMAHNQKRLDDHIKTPFFDLLTDGTLQDPKCNEVFVRLLKSWSSKFQMLLHARSACTTQEDYREVFAQHFKEEVGHDELIKSQRKPIWDPTFEACANWFLHQMIVSDHAVRLAIVHLVLENGAHAFHERAARILNSQQDYYQIHAQHDCHHAEMGMDLLKELTTAQLERVHEAVDRAWDMLDAMLGRVSDLARSEKGK